MVFNPFFLGPIVLFLLLVLSGIWIDSLLRRKNRLWTTACLLGFFAIFAIHWFVLPFPAYLQVYGIRDRVMQACTLDDLRRFAQAFDRNMPDTEIFHGDTSHLSTTQMAAYNTMHQSYPFLDWGLGSNDGPSIKDSDDEVSVCWGGALPGHWGFIVAVHGKKVDLYETRDFRILHMSDDIIFSSGG